MPELASREQSIESLLSISEVVDGAVAVEPKVSVAFLPARVGPMLGDIAEEQERDSEDAFGELRPEVLLFEGVLGRRDAGVEHHHVHLVGLDVGEDVRPELVEDRAERALPFGGRLRRPGLNRAAAEELLDQDP